MKRIVALLAAAFLVAPAMAFHSTPSSSTYDCDSCHIPHKAQSLTDMPLWSGTMTTQTSWTKYTSETMDTAAGDPEGPTLLCLACHDATDGAKHAINTVGGDLSGTHPIEISYATAAAEDPELYPETNPSNVVNGRGTIAEDLVSPTNGYVNCQSCHDIHIQGLHGQTVDTQDDTGQDVTFEFDMPHLVNIPGIQWQLTRSGKNTPWLAESYELTYGALCKTCHIK